MSTWSDVYKRTDPTFHDGYQAGIIQGISDAKAEFFPIIRGLLEMIGEHGDFEHSVANEHYGIIRRAEDLVRR